MLQDADSPRRRTEGCPETTVRQSPEKEIRSKPLTPAAYRPNSGSSLISLRLFSSLSLVFYDKVSLLFQEFLVDPGVITIRVPPDVEDDASFPQLAWLWVIKQWIYLPVRCWGPRSTGQAVQRNDDQQDWARGRRNFWWRGALQRPGHPSWSWPSSSSRYCPTHLVTQ